MDKGLSETLSSARSSCSAMKEILQLSVSSSRLILHWEKYRLKLLPVLSSFTCTNFIIAKDDQLKAITEQCERILQTVSSNGFRISTELVLLVLLATVLQC